MLLLRSSGLVHRSGSWLSVLNQLGVEASADGDARLGRICGLVKAGLKASHRGNETTVNARIVGFGGIIMVVCRREKRYD